MKLLCGVMEIATNTSVAFDAIACTYDEEFTRTPIGKMHRERVLKFLRPSLQNKSLNILEINCGTGEDAVWLAKNGHLVTATDSSAKMMEMAREKIAEGKLEDKISLKRLRFDELKESLPGRRFDLIFSDFGGLNCVSENELRKLAADFSSLLNENGKLIAVVMGRRCWWEQFYFSVKGKFKRAFLRNSKGAVEADLNGKRISTWYYSPAEFGKILSPHFKMITKRPIGLFIPPSYLNCFFAERKFLLGIFSALEKIFSFPFLSNYADHFYEELKKI